MTKLCVILAFLLSSLAVAIPCAAQSIGLAPAQIVHDFKPGVPFEQDLTVQNYGNDTVELHVQITDFWYNDKNDKTFDTPGSQPRSAANWIQFVPEKFQVGPHASQQLKAIITPPVNANGGYYAVLFVESTPVKTNKVTDDGRTVFTNMRIGCLVMLNAATTADYKVELGDVKLTPPSAHSDLSLAFTVNNESNTHIFPLPRLSIFDRQHKLVAKSEGEMKRLLPGQKDSLKVNWSGTLPPGSYSAVLTLVFGDRVETRELAFDVKGES
ncbi:MAG: hypothetical protein ACRD3E_14830 [Terriglobales bacterium]